SGRPWPRTHRPARAADPPPPTPPPSAGGAADGSAHGDALDGAAPRGAAAPDTRRRSLRRTPAPWRRRARPRAAGAAARSHWPATPPRRSRTDADRRSRADRSGSYRDQGLQLTERRITDPRHVVELIDRAEAAVLIPVLDDPLRQ